MIVTNEQWELYQKKYGNLIYTIATKISGDTAICSIDDNISELNIAALDSIKGFYNKTGMNFEEMMGSKLFDGYTKTVLWHRKNKKGKAITNRKKLANIISIDSGDEEDGNLLEVIESKPIKLRSDFEEMMEMTHNLTPEEAKVIEIIAENPSVISTKATVYAYSVANISGMPIYRVKKAIDGLKRKLRMFHE